MTGSSGARFAYTADHVIKMGDYRVVEQGKWLLDRGPIRSLPHIISVESHGYTMERLTPWRKGSLELLTGALVALDHTWSIDAPRVEFYEPLHDAKVANVADASTYAALKFVRAEIDWDVLPVANTHGDPTLENVMMRGDEFVLIDPIPSTPAVPDLRCVDLGKVMQSIVGYEYKRYGDRRHWAGIGPENLRALADVDEQEWYATKYWCVVHLLRAAKYAPLVQASDIRKLADEVLSLI